MTNGSVTRLLKKTGLQPLQERRQLLRLTLFYRVVEGLAPALPPEKKNGLSKNWSDSLEHDNNLTTLQPAPFVTA